MKKLFIFFALPLVFLAEGCGKFTEGYGVDPNNPTTATPALVLSSAELGLYSTYTSNLDRIAVVLTQQASGADGQLVGIDRYDGLGETDNSNEWNNLYNSVVQPANDLIINYSEVNQNYGAVAKIIKAMALGIATDVWGDVPATEAGMGVIDGNLTPKFDTQESIIAYIQTLLDEAIVTLNDANAENIATMGNDDFIFKGDTKKWVNTAYILKARYANRLSKKDPQGSASQALGILANVTDAGDANAVYGTANAEQNQWYVFDNQREGYFKMGKFMVDLMLANGDPRLPFYASPAADGSYKGGAPGAADASASNLGDYLAGMTSPMPMVTYAEALFIKAEASLRAGDAAAAATAYNEAVIHSVTTVTNAAPDSTFTDAHAAATAATITQEMIMTEKYLSEFGQIEVWTDWRRTGFPVLTPAPNHIPNENAIPRRLMTVVQERQYNPNAILVQSLFTPVWWDAQ